LFFFQAVGFAFDVDDHLFRYIDGELFSFLLAKEDKMQQWEEE